MKNNWYKNKKIVIPLAVLALILVATTVGVMAAVNNKEETANTKQAEDINEQVSPTPIITPEPTKKVSATPSATPKPTTQSSPTPTKTVTPETTTVASANVISCGNNCTYAPVDKTRQLPSSYNPGGMLPAAQSAYNQLASSAKSNGLSLEVISSFRSYATQASTFEYWVGTEMQRGKSRAQAEAAANEYSARPGHSEHQLGTTYDVKCVGCVSFNSSQNAAVYKFVEINAHKFGFVISYPRNSSHLTGYTYEPWHIRWIGESLATELYNTGYINGNGNYLTKFLISKGY